MRAHFSILSISGLLFLLVLGGIIFYLYALNLIIEATERRGLSDIRQIHKDLIEYEPEGELSLRDFQNIVKSQSRILSARVIIIDMDSYLLADSEKKEGDISGQYINAELSDAKLRPYASSSLPGRSPGDFTVTIAQRKEFEGKELVISV
nr:hypothetical protein [Oceanispirochaeta sp.]